MIKKFTKIYGPPTQVAIYYGDWSETNHRKFHETVIKGKAIRELFRKAGYFALYFIYGFIVHIFKKNICILPQKNKVFLQWNIFHDVVCQSSVSPPYY
jgi:hypothetical protein